MLFLCYNYIRPFLSLSFQRYGMLLTCWVATYLVDAHQRDYLTSQLWQRCQQDIFLKDTWPALLTSCVTVPACAGPSLLIYHSWSATTCRHSSPESFCYSLFLTHFIFERSSVYLSGEQFLLWRVEGQAQWKGHLVWWPWWGYKPPAEQKTFYQRGDSICAQHGISLTACGNLFIPCIRINNTYSSQTAQVSCAILVCENIRETDGINSGARCRTHSSDKLQNASLTPPFVGMFYEESKTRNLESSSKLIQVEYLSVLRSPRQHFSEVSATFQDILFCKQHALGKKRWAMCLLYVQSGHGWEGRPQPKELAQPWVQEGVLWWAVGWSSLSRSDGAQLAPR